MRTEQQQPPMNFAKIWPEHVSRMKTEIQFRHQSKRFPIGSLSSRPDRVNAQIFMNLVLLFLNRSEKPKTRSHLTEPLPP